MNQQHRPRFPWVPINYRLFERRMAAPGVSDTPHLDALYASLGLAENEAIAKAKATLEDKP
jgi:hypothetical protein